MWAKTIPKFPFLFHKNLTVCLNEVEEFASVTSWLIKITVCKYSFHPKLVWISVFLVNFVIKKNPKEKWNAEETFSALPPILFFFLMWSTLGVKTEYSYVTKKHMASFPFRILKPETSFNIFMPSDSMTVSSQKVNGSLRSKVHLLAQERGVLQVKQREMMNFHCFFP